MANDNTKLQYIVELLTQGDTSKAVSELNKLNATSKTTASSMTEIGTQFKAAFAIIAGSQFINQSINAFLEQERAIAKVNAALKATAQFTPEVSKEMQELAGAMAQVSTFADEEILNVIAKLTAMGAKTTDVQRLTRAVLDLSTLMDRDLNRATMAFSQALNGNVEALRQAGIMIDDTKTATEQFNDALTQIEEKAGGQSAAAVETLGGKFEVLKKNLGEVKETIGGVILEFGEPFIRALNGASKAVSEFQEKNRGLISTLISLANPGLGLLRTGLQAIQQAAPATAATPFPLTAESNAALMRLTGTGQPAPVTTAALSLKDQLSDLEEIARLDDEIVKLTNEQAESRHLIANEVDLEMKDTFERFENGERIKQDLVDQTVLVMLDGEARIRAEMEINHDNRIRMINEEKFESQDQYDAAMRAEALLFAEEKRRHDEAQTFSGRMKVDMEQLGEQGMRSFSSGLAGAMVDAFSEGEKAFQKFAANFMKQIAEMILQMIIFNALKSATKSFFSGGGQATAMAAGGMIYAAGGISGVSEVTRATHFPNFNVVAGEAGREVMTVLARPSFERINGVPAQIGYAGGNRLAITSADALAGAGGGAGGIIDIRVTMSPDVKAEVISNSVKQARVAVVQDMSNDSQLSRVTRQKMS